jgi:hypothetical protein
MADTALTVQYSYIDPINLMISKFSLLRLVPDWPLFWEIEISTKYKKYFRPRRRSYSYRATTDEITLLRSQ